MVPIADDRVPHRHHLASLPVFFRRLGANGALAFGLIAVTLLVGTIGYRALAGLTWIDAFHQASLLMSGMGPLDESGWATGAKLFDSVYALFCGVVLLVSYGVLFAPILHRFLHKFHIDDVGRD